MHTIQTTYFKLAIKNTDYPKHHFEKIPDGEEWLNYLCAGYKRFFKHADPTMKKMTELMHARTAPASIMGMLRV